MSHPQHARQLVALEHQLSGAAAVLEQQRVELAALRRQQEIQVMSAQE
jgi:hypothetical protein